MDEVKGFEQERFFLLSLSETYNVEALRRMLHDAELNETVDAYYGEPTAGFWQHLAALLREAIPFRQIVDRQRAARHAKSPLIKEHKRLDFDEIKERIDIVEYIGRHVRLKKAGKGWVGLCPFHPDTQPSFWVWPNIKAFRCFGCDAKGDVITFHKLIGEKGGLG